MPSYIIKKFHGGISDFSDKGIEGSFKFGSNLDIRRDRDSLLCKQDLAEEGLSDGRSPSSSVSPSTSVSASPSLSPSASPSATPSPSASASPSSSVSLSPSVTPSSSISPSPSLSTAVTSVFRDLIRFFVKATDGYTYGFGSTGYIYRRDADAYWQVVYKDANGAIKGAIEKPSSTGKTYLQWATDTTLNRKELPGLTNWNDVEIVAGSGAGAYLNSADWHTMVQVGGANMIANGSWLALVGYDDSYTNEALDLIPGNTVKTLVERNGRVVTGTYRASDPSKGINAAIDTEVPLAQVGTDGQLIFADFSNSIPVKKFPGGGQVNPGGVTNEIDQVNFFDWDTNALSWIDKQSVGNMSLWAVYGGDTGKGGIYSYGRYNKAHPFVLNLDYQLDADELGALVSVDGTILVSYRDGSDFGVKAVDSTAKAIATYEGLELKSPDNKGTSQITHWTTAEIYLEPLPDGASLEFWYKVNVTGDWVRSYVEDGSQLFRAYGETKAIFFIDAQAEIIEPKLVIYPTGNTSPEITRIKMNFD